MPADPSKVAEHLVALLTELAPDIRALLDKVAPAKDPDELLTFAQVGEAWGVTEGHARRLVSRGLPTVDISPYARRVRRGDMEAFQRMRRKTVSDPGRTLREMRRVS